MSASPAITLYQGQTVHERLQPFLHRFRYPLLSIMIDVDRLQEAGRSSKLFSFERFNLFSFRQKDHGPRDGSSLAVWSRNLFRSAGLQVDQLSVRLLCFPRVLGYVFNPLSVYFAEDRDGALKGLIYQVHNTFGDDHAYVVATESGSGAQKHDADKVFHVSPFFDVAGRYEFKLRQNQESFRLVIHKQRETGPDLLATMSLKPSRVTSGNLIKAFLKLPFSTTQAIVGIHFQALRLMLKGACYHKRPSPPDKPSFGYPHNEKKSALLGQKAK